MTDGPDYGYSMNDDRNDEDEPVSVRDETPMGEPVDIHNSEQNAFVQNWLHKWTEVFPRDHNSMYEAIEIIQELYNYKDHEERRLRRDGFLTE